MSYSYVFFQEKIKKSFVPKSGYCPYCHKKKKAVHDLIFVIFIVISSVIRQKGNTSAPS